MTYQEFLAGKSQYGEDSGFAPTWMPSSVFPFQEHLIEWSCRKGRAANWSDCGLGKSVMNLTWAENVVRHTNKRVLVLTPLAVAAQTIREADKFGIEAGRSSDGILPSQKIVVTNYERLHYFDPSDFIGVVCDESGCLKATDGKRRAQVTEFLRTLPYRLMATATAAPNDYIELGTTSEALGVMGQMDMLSRFFKNDQNTCDMKRNVRVPHGAPTVPAGWRFKGHAETAFWQWVTSFARACRKPSDLGFADIGFLLPPLIEREHIVEARRLADGMLFALPATNFAEEREERRRTVDERCEMAAELVTGTGKPFVIWCHLNDEGNLLQKLIPDAIQVSGADDDDAKEEAYEAFGTGKIRGIISKPKIGAWGLNWQHCAHVVEFASHSWEQHYQGVRRCWRFGQKSSVVNDIISTEGQRGAKDNMARKAVQADRMFESLVEHMNAVVMADKGIQFSKAMEAPIW